MRVKCPKCLMIKYFRATQKISTDRHDVVQMSAIAIEEMAENGVDVGGGRG